MPEFEEKEKSVDQAAETSFVVKEEICPIRLKSFTTDYATFARTTAETLGTIGVKPVRTKPNKRVLELVGLDW